MFFINAKDSPSAWWSHVEYHVGITCSWNSETMQHRHHLCVVSVVVERDFLVCRFDFSPLLSQFFDMICGLV